MTKNCPACGTYPQDNVVAYSLKPVNKAGTMFDEVSCGRCRVVIGSVPCEAGELFSGAREAWNEACAQYGMVK